MTYMKNARSTLVKRGPTHRSIRAACVAVLIACAVHHPAVADEPRDSVVIETTATETTYCSPWLKVSFSMVEPRMTYLSVDGTGLNRHSRNLLKAPFGGRPVVSEGVSAALRPKAACKVSAAGNTIRYSPVALGACESDLLTFTVHERSIDVSIERDIARECKAGDDSPWAFMFDVTVTPASPLGRLAEDWTPDKPALGGTLLVHFPDWGSLLVRARSEQEAPLAWRHTLLRDGKPDKWGAVAQWRFRTPEEKRQVEATGNRFACNRERIHVSPEQMLLSLRSGREGSLLRPGKQRIEVNLTVTSVYPEVALVDADPKLIGIRRAWLNIFGFRPDLGCLANNSVGDVCQLCLFYYADQALFTPPLFDDFTALDLVRTSLDRFFSGFKGYADGFQDVAPSTIIAAWDYAVGKPDTGWLAERIGNIEKYAERMIAMDTDDDGLCESEKGPTNWWDNFDYDGKDAYSSALSWRAFVCIADLEERLGDKTKARRYRERAARIKAVYYKTFFNPETGVLAGWRSRDGKLHDKYFLWSNGIAISYGLLSTSQANAVLDKLQAKIREVGFASFQYGLPGNLASLGGEFPVYENGAATGSMAYHYLQALYAMERKTEADAIFNRMLSGYREGTFQNGIGNGGDWKEWDGTPSGYEGLLVDAYYPLTAFITGRLGRGVPLPGGEARGGIATTGAATR